MTDKNQCKKTMYNPKNKYLRWKRAIEITREHDGGEWTIYKRLWQKYIHPVLFISYSDYMKAINCPNIDALIAQETEKEEQRKAEVQRRQYALSFSDDGADDTA